MALEATQNLDSDINTETSDYPKNALQFDHEHVYAVVMLGEDLIMEATIDTGSTKSLISKYFADELRTDDNIIKFNTAIKLANGSTITAEEALVIDIKLGNRRRRTKLLILPQVRDEVILGMDFLCGIDTTLQLCGEVIKLQHNHLMKGKDENGWVNNNVRSNKGNTPKKENNTIIPTFLYKPNLGNNTLTVQATNTSTEKNDKKSTAIVACHTGVTILEDELHSLPLMLQQEITKIKQDHPQTNLNFDRIFDEQHFNIKISRNGAAKVKIYNTSKQQQGDNRSIPINAKLIPSAIGGRISPRPTIYPHKPPRDFLNKTAKQLPFIPVECSPDPLVSPIHLPLWQAVHKHNTEESEPSSNSNNKLIPLNQATMLSSFIPNVYPPVSTRTHFSPAVHKAQVACLHDHKSKTDEEQLKLWKPKRGGVQVKRRARLWELNILIPLVKGYHKQSLIAEERQLKKEQNQQRNEGKRERECEKQ